MDGSIRTIFSVTLLLLWVLFGLGLANDAWTATNWLMLGLAHMACAVVFVNFAYLFSYGYAFSMLAVHLAILTMLPSLPAFLVGGLGALYGVRLWWFVHARYQMPGYAGIRARGDNANAVMPLPAKLFLWIAVSWLMTFSAMAAYHVAASGTVTPWVVTGALVAAIGLLLESVADQQKQSAKGRDPDAFVRDGLYRLARHPNYSGEIVFQLGLIIALLAVTSTWYQLVSGVIAPLYVVILMTHEGRKADRDQQNRYGADPVYLEYRVRTGCFMPGI